MTALVAIGMAWFIVTVTVWAIGGDRDDALLRGTRFVGAAQLVEAESSCSCSSLADPGSHSCCQDHGSPGDRTGPASPLRAPVPVVGPETPHSPLPGPATSHT